MKKLFLHKKNLKSFSNLGLFYLILPQNVIFINLISNLKPNLYFNHNLYQNKVTYQKSFKIYNNLIKTYHSLQINFHLPILLVPQIYFYIILIIFPSNTLHCLLNILDLLKIFHSRFSQNKILYFLILNYHGINLMRADLLNLLKYEMLKLLLKALLNLIIMLFLINPHHENIKMLCNNNSSPHKLFLILDIKDFNLIFYTQLSQSLLIKFPNILNSFYLLFLLHYKSFSFYLYIYKNDHIILYLF